MVVTVQMSVLLWVIAHSGGRYPVATLVLGWSCASVFVLVCGRNTHWGLSWPCLWLLMGGSAALVLNSSPFLRVSLICSVSVNMQSKISLELSPCAAFTAWNLNSCVLCLVRYSRSKLENQLCTSLGLSIPLSESLRGCDPMQMDRLSSSSSGGRLRSSHTHLALTPLRLEPSVSIPWSTLSCLDGQEMYAIINTSLHKVKMFRNKKTPQEVLRSNRGC